MMETEQVEKVIPGLNLWRTHNGRIVVLQVTDISREVIDRWAKEVEGLYDHLPAGQPLLCLFDFSGVNFLTVTPYLSKKSRELAAIHPEVSGRSAVLVPSGGFVIRVISGFVNALRRSNSYRARKLFTSKDDAVKWLEELITK